MRLRLRPTPSWRASWVVTRKIRSGSVERRSRARSSTSTVCANPPCWSSTPAAYRQRRSWQCPTPPTMNHNGVIPAGKRPKFTVERPPMDILEPARQLAATTRRPLFLAALAHLLTVTARNAYPRPAPPLRRPPPGRVATTSCCTRSWADWSPTLATRRATPTTSSSASSSRRPTGTAAVVSCTGHSNGPSTRPPIPAIDHPATQPGQKDTSDLVPPLEPELNRLTYYPTPAKVGQYACSRVSESVNDGCARVRRLTTDRSHRHAGGGRQGREPDQHGSQVPASTV
jgi:hypothetical protein